MFTYTSSPMAAATCKLCSIAAYFPANPFKSSEYITGLGFCAAKNARIMILGSMPSRKSLAEQQYYAHPRNAFWPIMGELFEFAPALPYERRLSCLRDSGIALWDVAYQCVRPGSLDAHISEVQANDFNGFFTLHPHIHAIFFNGRKAEEMYRRLVMPNLLSSQNKLSHTGLPSSSPAHAARSFDEKLAVWQTVKQALETDSI